VKVRHSMGFHHPMLQVLLQSTCNLQLDTLFLLMRRNAYESLLYVNTHTHTHTHMFLLMKKNAYESLLYVNTHTHTHTHICFCL